VFLFFVAAQRRATRVRTEGVYTTTTIILLNCFNTLSSMALYKVKSYFFDVFSKTKNVGKILRSDLERGGQAGSESVEFFERMLKIKKMVIENVKQFREIVPKCTIQKYSTFLFIFSEQKTQRI
jgi:hypothetical protein